MARLKLARRRLRVWSEIRLFVLLILVGGDKRALPADLRVDLELVEERGLGRIHRSALPDLRFPSRLRSPVDGLCRYAREG